MSMMTKISHHNFIQSIAHAGYITLQHSQEMPSMYAYIFHCLLIIVMNMLEQEGNKKDRQIKRENSSQRDFDLTCPHSHLDRVRYDFPPKIYC